MVNGNVSGPRYEGSKCHKVIVCQLKSGYFVAASPSCFFTQVPVLFDTPDKKNSCDFFVVPCDQQCDSGMLRGSKCFFVKGFPYSLMKYVKGLEAKEDFAQALHGADLLRDSLRLGFDIKKLFGMHSETYLESITLPDLIAEGYDI